MRVDEVHKTSPESDRVAETNPRLRGILWNLWRWAASLALLLWKPYWVWHSSIQRTELDTGKFWQVLTLTHHISAVSSDGRTLWHCLEQPLYPSRILLPFNSTLWQPNIPSGGYFSGTISTSWPVPWPIFLPSNCWCLCFVFNFNRMQPQWE